MKDLIKTALDNAILLLDKQVPQTKKSIKSIDISDVIPLNLPQFMKDNNVPDTAFFDGRDNAYDAWYAGVTLLSWEIDIPTTDEDKLNFKKKRFTSIAWKYVYEYLTTSGYKREGYNSGLLREFKDTTVYDMYMNKDFDRLVKYYSLPFKLK